VAGFSQGQLSSCEFGNEHLSVVKDRKYKYSLSHISFPKNRHFIFHGMLYVKYNCAIKSVLTFNINVNMQ
jgi:hypothetical protein